MARHYSETGLRTEEVRIGEMVGDSTETGRTRENRRVPLTEEGRGVLRVEEEEEGTEYIAI